MQKLHGADAGQRLAAKTETAYLLQIAQTVYLAGGVTAQGQREIVLADAATVIAHAHQAYAALLHFDFDLARARVQAVFQQFLDDRGRALNHLAGGDLAYQHLGEALDARNF